MQRLFLAIASASFFLQTMAQPTAAIESGQRFLHDAFAKDRIHVNVRCIAPNSSYCPTTAEGKLFAMYFYVLALKDSLSASERLKILNSLAQLQKENQCFSYSQDAPIDADDTAFALQIFSTLGRATDLTCLNKKFYYPKQNLYSTFELSIEPSLQTIPSGKNNLGFHPEVNANIAVALFMLGKKNINFSFIATTQTADGSWPSYFYPSYYYSTFVFLRLLCNTKQLPVSINKGIQFILTTQNKDGGWGKRSNAYETALALSSLKACSVQHKHSYKTAIKKAENYLLKTRLPDGSWNSDEVIWQYPFFDDPLVMWVAYDDNRVIVSSLVIHALKNR